MSNEPLLSGVMSTIREIHTKCSGDLEDGLTLSGKARKTIEQMTFFSVGGSLRKT